MLNVYIIALHRAIYLSKLLCYVERSGAESQPLTVLSSTHSSLMSPKHFIFLQYELRQN